MQKILLLPRQKVTVSELGIKLWGLTYTGKEIIQTGWMHRSSEKCLDLKKLFAAYELGSANHIYLFPEEGKKYILGFVIFLVEVESSVI